MAGGAQESDESITGINVTPLVDIMLVLMIILMVQAREVVQSIPLDLPKTVSGGPTQSVFSIQLTVDGATYVDSKPIANDDAIMPLAEDAQQKNSELRVVIHADKAVQHGRVIHVLDLLKRAKVLKIAFGTSPEVSTTPQTPPK